MSKTKVAVYFVVRTYECPKGIEASVILDTSLEGSMSKRISGQSFDFNLDGSLIHVEKSTLNLTDNTGVAQTNGVPDGWVSGDVSAEGELEFSTKR